MALSLSLHDFKLTAAAERATLEMATTETLLRAGSRSHGLSDDLDRGCQIMCVRAPL